jgi:hypothetical protein
MSSSGIQNYLSNVFRQVYVFDTTAAVFVPKLELSNIDTYSGNSVSVFTAAVGDTASNVYVGSNAGNSYNTIRACSNVTAVGFATGSNISNVSNSVYIGASAGANTSNANAVIAIGASSLGGGTSNISIGNGTGVVGDTRTSNILIGHSFGTLAVSNQVRIGHGSRIPIAADLSYNWVGLGGQITPTNVTYATIDISGSTRIQGNLGLNIEPGFRTLDVLGNLRVRDNASNTLDFNGGLTTSSGGFTSIQSNIAVPAAATSIGQLKKGVVLISAVNQSNSADYASRMLIAYTNSNAVDLGSNVAAGDASITLSTSNIQITDVTNTTTYDYSITYFPLP